MEAGLAEGVAVGFCLAAFAAGGVEVDDVGHFYGVVKINPSLARLVFPFDEL